MLVGLWQLGDMTLSVPKPLEERLAPQAIALHFAIGLFVSDEATLGEAAEVAGLSQSLFLRELGRRKIPIHYDEGDLEADLETVDSIIGR